jgi:hypothetical protein
MDAESGVDNLDRPVLASSDQWRISLSLSISVMRAAG